jgi:hypothetical protein
MNHDESIAEGYLKSHYSNVVFEPDGNIPPDFSVNNTVGVEVRRLNQQHRENGTSKGLEEGRIPLLKALENEIAQYPQDSKGNNFWLLLRYERNIGKLKDIKKNIKSSISAFQSQGENIPFSFNLSENVTLEFVARAVKLPRKYKVGIESDNNSGGWVVSMYAQDTMHCISEKKEKIKPYEKQYKKWWLLLVDHISCMDSYDEKEIIEKLTKPKFFEKVIVIKIDGTKQFEI